MKKILNKILLYFGYVLAATAVLTLLDHTIALSALALVAVAIVCAVGYLHIKNKS